MAEFQWEFEYLKKMPVVCFLSPIDSTTGASKCTKLELSLYHYSLFATVTTIYAPYGAFLLLDCTLNARAHYCEGVSKADHIVVK